MSNKSSRLPSQFPWTEIENELQGTRAATRAPSELDRTEYRRHQIVTEHMPEGNCTTPTTAAIDHALSIASLTFVGTTSLAEFVRDSGEADPDQRTLEYRIGKVEILVEQLGEALRRVAGRSPR